jgi:hypothetical protein
MKNFCDKCSVEIESSVSHCPLCGRCVNEHLVGETSTHQNFPSNLKFLKDKKRAMVAIIWFLIFGNVLSVILEFALTGTLNTSVHILVATVFTFLGIIFPIRSNWAIVNYHSVFYLAFVGYMLFLSSFLTNGVWAIEYVIPLFALAFSVSNFIMVLTDEYTRSEYFLPMLILVVIVIFSFAFNYFNANIMWPSISAFCSVLTFTLLLMVIRRTKLGELLFKKLHF